MDAGVGLAGTDAGVEVQALAQAHVHRAEAGADGGADGALERHLVAADALEHGVGQGVLVARALHVGHAGFDLLPLELDAGGFQDAGGGAGDLGTDAVAGDQSDTIGHEKYLNSLVRLMNAPFYHEGGAFGV
ncbi:hypothetical protein D3C72_1804700 [compost metagenome]